MWSREKVMVRGTYSFYLHCSKDGRGRLKRQNIAKVTQSICPVSNLGLWKQAAHTSVGHGHMEANLAVQHE